MNRGMEFQSKFHEFNSENLANAILLSVSFMSQEPKQLQQELDEYIFPRLNFGMKNADDTLYFLFEKSYVETEWKDMIGLHYINTSYEVRNTVMRVHLFSTKAMREECYVGCFSLRTINEVHIMLSYIYPNWKLINYEGDLLNVMTCKKKVHLNGKEIVFHTYPLLVQDHAVVSCAQVCLISMSKYLHSRYDYNKIRLVNINNSYHSKKTKIYPTQGLYPTQMLEVLYNHDIPCAYEVYDDPEEFREYIDYCIESALPVLVGIHVKEKSKEKKTIKIRRHVIQIIGHSKKNDEKKYVIYDDSGYYLKNLAKKEIRGDGFYRVISWEVLSKSLERNKSFMIYPIHEKVYFLYKNFTKHLKDAAEETKQRRIMLIDNKEVKQFLDQHIVHGEGIRQNVRREAKRLLRMDMPHYLWCCECALDISGEVVLYLADPTYNRRTTKSILVNKIPLMCKSHIELLKYE